MRYRLKKGVVLFAVCGEHFLFPSREAGKLPPILLSITKEMACTLGSTEPFSLEDLSSETQDRIRRYAAVGIIEEFQE